jgi:ribonucleoside-triphosphate reductase
MGDLSGSISVQNTTPIYIPEETSPFRSLLSEFIYVRTYSRWVDELGRRETWTETVDRYIEYMAVERPSIPRHVLLETRAAILTLKVLPSMRALWAAGEAARRDNTCMYNCSFIPLDSIPSFAEALHILMCGTGVGFSVERQFTDNLPVVAPLTGETISYKIADSTEGWADSLKFGLTQWYKGNKVEFDFSGLRARGTPLKTKGGRASGPEPLQRLLALCEVVLLSATGRKLRPIECHDIACAIGDIVHVGGFRRAALISFSDPDDEEMRHAKDWSRGEFPTIRYMSNNSAFYDERPTEEKFWDEWRALVASKSGERGFFRMPPAKRATRRGDYRCNPCGEIGLRFTKSVDPWTGEGGSGSFCNLTAAVMRADDTKETMAEKVRVATWLGIIQATFIDFPYLRKGWRQICDEDRLLGVDITGQCDNPALSDNVETMTYFNQVARETAAEAAAVMGINMPAAITCGKPSGNSSQLVDCSSGFHPRYARHYLRRVRIDGKDPLTALLRDSGVPMHKENGMGHLADAEVPVWVVEFPVKAPATAMVRDSETAVEMCERYLRVMRSWCGERGHNQSATIYVRDHEWEDVGRWVFEHFDEITGLAFLPHDGGSYKLAPYEEITEDQYDAAMSIMPVVDFSLLTAYEQDDRGKGATELACMGGSCEL